MWHTTLLGVADELWLLLEKLKTCSGLLLTQWFQLNSENSRYFVDCGWQWLEMAPAEENMISNPKTLIGLL